MKTLLAFAAAAAFCWPTALVYGVDLPTPKNAWYRIELIIFERTATDPDLADQPPEVLLVDAPRAFPFSPLAFGDADSAAYYPLAEATLAEPAFPEVELLPIIEEVYAPSGQTVAEAVEETAPPELELAAVQAPTPTPAEHAAALIDAYEASLFDASQQWLGSAALQLQSEAQRLRRNNAYRVLLHDAWMQAVPPRDAPLPVMVQVGDRLADTWLIEGTLAVTVSRYLHVDARLWYGDVEAGGGDGYIEMAETRRLRSGELNYFDHPRFGMLMRIDPVEPPASLITDLEQILAPPNPSPTATR